MTTTVDSMTQAGISYTVTIGPRTATCTCPHYQHSLAGTLGECKHIRAARAARIARLAEKAAALSLAELEALLPRYEAEKRLDVALAIRVELQARQQEVTNKPCPQCQGKGGWQRIADDETWAGWVNCPACRGTGTRKARQQEVRA